MTKYIRSQDGISDRLPASAAIIFDQANNKFLEMESCHKEREKGLVNDCYYGLEEDVSTIVIGDSHAMS